MTLPAPASSRKSDTCSSSWWNSRSPGLICDRVEARFVRKHDPLLLEAVHRQPGTVRDAEDVRGPDQLLRGGKHDQAGLDRHLVAAEQEREPIRQRLHLEDRVQVRLGDAGLQEIVDLFELDHRIGLPRALGDGEPLAPVEAEQVSCVIPHDIEVLVPNRPVGMAIGPRELIPLRHSPSSTLPLRSLSLCRSRGHCNRSRPHGPSSVAVPTGTRNEDRV